MSRRIALWSLRLVAGTLPPARRSWGEAMRAELDHVEGGGAALAFALGCVAAALGERLRAMTGIEAARLGFAASTLGLALFLLNCAVDGVRILGGGSDPFYLQLLQSGQADAAAHWRAMTPLMTLGLGAMGLFYVQAAIFAARARRGAYAKWIAAGMAAAAFQAIVVLDVLGYTAGLRTFLAVMSGQAAFSILLWRFGMNETAERMR